MAGEILLVDDQEEVLEHLSKLLVTKGYTVLCANERQTAFQAFLSRKDSLQLVILDLDLGDPDGDRGGLELLKRMKQVAPDVPVVILSGKGNIRYAVNAMRLGAQDFLEKNLYLSEHLEVSLAKVKEFLQVLRDNERLRAERENLKRKSDFYEDLLRSRYAIVGESPALRRALEESETAGRIPRPVLLVGERGTGKELFAAHIHFSSECSSGPFVVVNCAALPGQLLGSELFGHEKGAFTGAEARKLGRFEVADGGTLFFDEIGNMAAEFQDKILRAIEYQEFERVGGTEKIRVNVRVLAATNADLEKLMGEGRFRKDLYDRLTFKTILLPPLRARKSDIPLLVEHFVSEILTEVPLLGRKVFSPEAMEKLLAYDWPGNVRELKNVVERAVAFAPGQSIGPDEIFLPSVSPGEGLDFKSRVEEFERRLVSQALELARGNQKRCAQMLGLTYDQFRHYYRKFMRE